MHVSDDDSNMFCKFDEIDELWKMLKFHDFSRVDTISIFLWKKLSSLNRLKFHMHVSDENPINPASLMKVGEICKKCWNFIIFQGLTLSAFFFELKFNFSEKAQISHACFWWWFKYVLQVWWNLVNFGKRLKFNDISRAGTVGIFLWKKLTSLKRLKFHMHVSDDYSNMFCNFDEIWWTLEKKLKFHDISRAGTLSIFLWKN